MHPLFKLSSILAVLALTLVYSVYSKKKIDEVSDQSKSFVLEQIAEFTAKDVLSGEELSNKTLLEDKLDAIVIHFWGTWCAPCEVEFPELLDLIKRFDSQNIKFVLLAVNDKEKEIKKFLRRFKDLPKNAIIALDNSGMAMENFGTIKVPETYLYDSKGRSINKYIGPQEWGLPYFYTQISKAL